MSKLNDLILELCPDGVEFVELGEVVDTITAPTKLNSKEYSEIGKIPIIDQGIKYIAGYTDKHLPTIKQGEYIIFGDHSEHIKYVNFEFIQGADGLKILKPISANAKYIYYAFENFYIKELSYKRHWTKAKETQIPLPPLEVQEEIVRILDNFTELTAELTARKKQYEYYRDKLLNFDDIDGGGYNPLLNNTLAVSWKTLGEVATLVRGNGMPKSDFTDTGVGCIHYGQIYTYYGTYTSETKSFVSKETASKLKKVNKNDIIITNTSENFEDVCKAVVWLGDDDIVTGGHATIIKGFTTPKFLAYYTQTKMFYSDKRKYATGTKVIDISANNLAKIQIPVPTLEEQERIVGILDRFDTLCHDITEGLPAEIKARQQQYEYYRDKLLTFKELEAK